MAASTDSLADLQAVLPWWVIAMVWFGIPCVGALIGLVCTSIVDKTQRFDLHGLHWTERARRLQPGTKLVEMQGVLHGALTGALTYTMGDGVLVAIEPVPRAVGAGLFVWAVCTIVEFRRAKWLIPHLDVKTFVRGQLFWWLVHVPILGVAILMAGFGPADFGVTFVVVHGGGVLLIAWIVHSGGLPLCRLAGMLRPADERLRRLVDEVATERGHQPRRVWIARAPVANVIAFPVTNELMLTDLALRELDDDEIRALARIENARLVKPMGSFPRRLASVSLFILVGMWNPIVTHLGVLWFAGLALASIVLVLKSVALTHKTIDSVDQSAAGDEDESDQADYARALERLFELNLTPVVTATRVKPQPDLYDRMLAIGVEPDYPRPEPPSGGGKPHLLFALLALGIYVALIFAIAKLHDDAARSESHAHVAIGLSGGSTFTIAGLGRIIESTDPDRAVICFQAASDHSRWPGYTARLARLLADRDPDRARALLQEVEERVEEWGVDEIDPTSRGIIDDARKRVGLPARDW